MHDKFFPEQQPEDTPEIKSLLRLAIKYYEMGNIAKAGELLKLVESWRSSGREQSPPERGRPAA